MVRIITDRIWKCVLHHLYPSPLPIYSPGAQVLVFAQHWAWVSISTGPAVMSAAFQLSFSDAHQTCLFQSSPQSEWLSCCPQSRVFKQQLFSHDTKSIFLTGKTFLQKKIGTPAFGFTQVLVLTFFWYPCCNAGNSNARNFIAYTSHKEGRKVCSRTWKILSPLNSEQAYSICLTDYTVPVCNLYYFNY